MKLVRVTTKGKEVLALNPDSGVYWVATSDAKHPVKKRLTKSTGKTTITAAMEEAEKLIEAWQLDRKTPEEKHAEAEKVRAEEAERLAKLAAEQEAERRKNILFKDVADEYQGVCDRSSRDRDTKVKIASILKNHLKPYFGEMKFAEITPAIIKGYIAQFQKERPGQTLYDQMKYLNAVFRHGAGEKYIPEPVITANPDPEKEIGRALTEAEQERLYAAARPSEVAYLRVDLGLGHGLRPEEVGHLEYTEIGADGVVTIPGWKTKRRKKAKKFPLHPDTFGLLMVRKARSDSRYVFPQLKRAGQSADKPDLDWASPWKRLKRDAGIDERPKAEGGPGRLRFDDLRHTWLTQAAKNLKLQHQKSITVLKGAIETIRGAESKEAILQILTEALLTMVADKLDYGIPEICTFAQHDIKVFQTKYLHIDPDELAVMPKMIDVPSRRRFE